MIKKIVLSSFASVLLLSQVANAEIKLGDKGSFGTIAFNAGYNTTYVWRGIDQNSGSGSPYIGADLTTPIGLYIGTWTAASTAGLGNNVAGAPNQEIDIYAGIAKTFGAVTADIGVIEYRYPGSNKPATPNNFLEFYGKLKFAPDKAPYSLQLAYFIDDTEGQINGTKKGNGKNYQEVSGTYNFPAFTVAASYGEYKSETDTTTITVSKSMFDLNFSASYIDADAKVATSSAATRTNSNKEFFVVNVSKTF
jgi:uncharacterized protein (TIGR02001 family)